MRPRGRPPPRRRYGRPRCRDVDLHRPDRLPATAAAATTSSAPGVAVVQERDVRAFGREQLDDRAPDAPAARRDDRHVAREASVQRHRHPEIAEAAVDEQRGTVDHRGFRQAQQVDGAGDVLGGELRARGRRWGELGEKLLPVREVGKGVKCRQRRRHAFHTDAPRPDAPARRCVPRFECRLRCAAKP